MTALEDVKVLDFSWVVAGPLISLCLAQHGATVVRIESTFRPEVLRYARPYKDNIPGINRSGYFAILNANKYSMALNLNHPQAIAVVKRLVLWADLVVENFTAGEMEKWGLGYENLKEINPGIIFVRCSVYGQTGPQAKHPGLGPFLAGSVGFQHLTGWPDRVPVVTAALTDQLAPDYALVLALRALDNRNKTGKGEYIDVSQYEVSMQAMAPLLLDYFVNSKEAGRTGNSCPYAAPHGAYRCQGEDRWCAIAIFTDDEWRVFCNIIGKPELATDTKFATLSARKENEEALNQLVEEWTTMQTAEEVMTRLQNSGIAAGVVANAEDLIQDPQLKHNQRFWVIEHPEIGPAYHFGHPFHVSRTPAQSRSPSPCLGEHTEYVCKEILNMDDTEFINLFNEKVFE
ncbi:CaiB/BaiF CoA transferase family protein [Chloroflexota bacterium]